MPNFTELLKKPLSDNRLMLSEETIGQLANYLNLLETWNQAFNLTAITDPREMVYLHIIDSLTVLPYLKGTRMLDVGSGAGLPGIPLAILHPEQHWVLLDKNSKKTRFQTQVIAELGLNNVEPVHSRCEDFQPDVCFDSILSRAFGTLRMFVETTGHLLCPHGVFIAMKGKYPEAELNDLPPRFLTQNVTRLAVNGIEGERHVVCMRFKD